MEIRIGIDNGIPFCLIPQRTVDLTILEEQFVENLFRELAKELDKDIFRLDKRSDAYTTVCCSDDYLSDFLRFKLTERTKWFSVAISQKDIVKYKDSDLFKDQKNKRERYWKVKLKNDYDLSSYIPIIRNAIIQQLSYENK